MPDVTQILSRIEAGDPRATEQLLPLVYDELRKLAAARAMYHSTAYSSARTPAASFNHADQSVNDVF